MQTKISSQTEAAIRDSDNS